MAPEPGIRRRAAGRSRSLLLGWLVGAALALSGVTAAFGGEFGGVGLQVVPTVRGELVVLNVLPGSSAALAGLKPGDLILRVDDFPLEGSDFSEVVSRYLWGEVGTSLVLDYLRPGEAGFRSARLRREPLSGEPAALPGVKTLQPQP
ncbi:hypothetical protein DESUT3_19070 [Desulfuromonas versatilis]|uniref:PDZ domain-containing protein n=1 Tax=Desulfuromonas versatilis TaxID=2802975 RepID=A0ABM8HRC6_9BACT|nr:PDZ domain-containing protein [Desulfuromonas versatilis]BCR04838.1 hypothetical protein DESUT3_19070 [Desulfuromonas versatilis]